MRYVTRPSLLALAIFAALAPGCTSQVLPGREYVEADRATYEAVEPYMRDHADANPADADGIDYVLRQWDRRVTAAESAYQD